jgi:hypothetical protein
VASTGTFEIGSRSGLGDAQVMGGVAVAAAGLIVLVGLAAGARMRRNRRASAVTEGDADASPEVVDSSGVVWHQILDHPGGEGVSGSGPPGSAR